MVLGQRREVCHKNHNIISTIRHAKHGDRIGPSASMPQVSKALQRSSHGAEQQKETSIEDQALRVTVNHRKKEKPCGGPSGGKDFFATAYHVCMQALGTH